MSWHLPTAPSQAPPTALCRPFPPRGGGWWEAASGPLHRARLQALPRKTYLGVGGSYCGHLILSPHTCPSGRRHRRYWRAAGEATGFLSAPESSLTHPLLGRTGSAVNRRGRRDTRRDRERH